MLLHRNLPLSQAWKPICSVWTFEFPMARDGADIRSDSIMQTLAADGWLDEMGAEHFAANKVTHAMTDPDFQSLVAHW